MSPMDPSTAQQAPLPDGSDVGGYDITRTLGFGTFGIVYRAEGHVLKDPVAIKEFFPRDIADRIDTERVTPKQDHAEEFAWALERFVSEAKTLRELAEPQPHPNIIQVRHVIEKNGTSYFVMKWEEGEVLEAVLKREPRWDEGRRPSHRRNNSMVSMGSGRTSTASPRPCSMRSPAASRTPPRPCIPGLPTSCGTNTRTASYAALMQPWS